MARDVIKIKENAGVGTLVANFSLYDADPCWPQNDAYVKIISSEYSHFFQADKNVVRVKENIDFEALNDENFIIAVQARVWKKLYLIKAVS